MIPLDSHDPGQVASSPAEGQFHTLSEPRDPMRRGISPVDVRVVNPTIPKSSPFLYMFMGYKLWLVVDLPL